MTNSVKNREQVRQFFSCFLARHALTHTTHSQIHTRVLEADAMCAGLSAVVCSSKRLQPHIHTRGAEMYDVVTARGVENTHAHTRGWARGERAI